MKQVIRVTLIASAAWICTVGWLIVAFAIFATWAVEDCFPNDLEYPCPSPTTAWVLTIGSPLAMAALTVLIWLGLRSLTRRR
jgi:hypothetical protein